MELMRASHEWATRPNDERFTSLTDMQAEMALNRSQSSARVVSSRKLTVIPDEASPLKGLQVVGASGVPFAPTNWSFGQLASLVKAPGGYLRDLPAPLAADCLNYGLKYARDIEDVGVLLRADGIGRDPAIKRTLMAATGARYGRVWNSEIVDNLVDRFGDGVSGHFRIPGEFGKAIVPSKANTTLFASDRDMFVFLADEQNRVTIPNRRDGKSGSLARGFFVWNSEVGAATFGVAMFLFDYACSNRIVWGAQDYKEIRLRHTASAPDKWLEQVAPVIAEYAQSSALPIETTLRNAQAARIADRADSLDSWLASRKFTGSQISGMKDAHLLEEGRPIETLWDATTAATAYAKTIAFQGERIKVERMGGDILDLVAAD